MSLREGWRCVCTAAGALCAMMAGMRRMQLWFAGNWDTHRMVGRCYSGCSCWSQLLTFPPPPLTSLPPSTTTHIHTHSPGSAYGIRNANFGPGSGLIYLDNVRCTGTEATLLACRGQDPGDHNCRPTEDAGVFCPSKWLASGELYALTQIMDAPFLIVAAIYVIVIFPCKALWIMDCCEGPPKCGTCRLKWTERGHM